MGVGGELGRRRQTPAAGATPFQAARPNGWWRQEHRGLATSAHCPRGTSLKATPPQQLAYVAAQAHMLQRYFLRKLDAVTWAAGFFSLCPCPALLFPVGLSAAPVTQCPSPHRQGC